MPPELGHGFSVLSLAFHRHFLNWKQNIEAFAVTFFRLASAHDLPVEHKLINLKDIHAQCMANLLLLHQ